MNKYFEIPTCVNRPLVQALAHNSGGDVVVRSGQEWGRIQVYEGKLRKVECSTISLTLTDVLGTIEDETSQDIDEDALMVATRLARLASTAPLVSLLALFDGGIQPFAQWPSSKDTTNLSQAFKTISRALDSRAEDAPTIRSVIVSGDSSILVALHLGDGSFVVAEYPQAMDMTVLAESGDSALKYLRIVGRHLSSRAQRWVGCATLEPGVPHVQHQNTLRPPTSTRRSILPRPRSQEHRSPSREALLAKKPRGFAPVFWN